MLLIGLPKVQTVKYLSQAFRIAAEDIPRDVRTACAYVAGDGNCGMRSAECRLKSMTAFSNLHSALRTPQSASPLPQAVLTCLTKRL